MPALVRIDRSVLAAPLMRRAVPPVEESATKYRRCDPETMVRERRAMAPSNRVEALVQRVWRRPLPRTEDGEERRSFPRRKFAPVMLALAPRRACPISPPAKVSGGWWRRCLGPCGVRVSATFHDDRSW